MIAAIRSLLSRICLPPAALRSRRGERGIRRYALPIGLVLVMSNPVLAVDFELYRFRASDHKFLELGEQRIDDLVQRHFGSSLHGARDHDLALMQRLLDEKIVGAQDKRLLQDMGIVMGNFLRSELGMRWTLYVDDKGRSRALQLRNTEHILFPITMISRRAETGLAVDIKTVYDKALAIIEPYRYDFSAQKYRFKQVNPK